jgi:hypothetical protein
MNVGFDAELFEWRGPAPFVWAALTEDASDLVSFQKASYGWGAVPVRVKIGGTEWETSLLPKGDVYVLPVKAAVRAAEGIDIGDVVSITLVVAPRSGRAANGTGPTC